MHTQLGTGIIFFSVLPDVFLLWIGEYALLYNTSLLFVLQTLLFNKVGPLGWPQRNPTSRVHVKISTVDCCCLGFEESRKLNE